jgi:mono/diheme cytochrome c family protein
MTTKMTKASQPICTIAALAVFLLALAHVVAQDNSVRPKNQIYAELERAPQKAMSRRNPLETDPDAVRAGAKLFDLHCAECHGPTAEGGRKAPSLRAPEVQQAAPGTLFWLLSNGVVRRGMPVWSKLPEPERWQLVRYIKSLSATSGEEAHPGSAH